VFRPQNAFFIDLDERESQPGMIPLKHSLDVLKLSLVFQSGYGYLTHASSLSAGDGANLDIPHLARSADRA
jgi:hypothetical protein